jgi:RNA polymerase sigma-70 factor (ECF subfamily)
MFHAVRGDLLRRLGRDAEAVRAYRAALPLASSTTEQEFLKRAAAETSPEG